MALLMGQTSLLLRPAKLPAAWPLECKKKKTVFGGADWQADMRFPAIAGTR